MDCQYKEQAKYYILSVWNKFLEKIFQVFNVPYTFTHTKNVQIPILYKKTDTCVQLIL